MAPRLLRAQLTGGMVTELRLYMFQTGTIRCKRRDVFLNDGDNSDFEIPVPWFLIKHPAGNVVIDGGIPVECAADPQAYWGEVADKLWPRFEESDGCVRRLADLGVGTDQVRFVLLSHLHRDHVGAIGRFKNAVHVVQRREIEYALSPDWFSRTAYLRPNFDREGLRWHYLEGDRTDFLDLYGDGSITLISTPGHSPGHQSFLVRTPQEGATLLAVDAVDTVDHWEERALPGFVCSNVEAVRSVQKLRFAANRANARLVPGHDPILWPKLKQAPDFYC